MMHVHRKIEFAVIVLMIMAGVISCGSMVYADTHVCGDYEYNILSDGTAKLVGYSGTEPDVVIPAKVDDYNVSTIGSNAFCFKTTIHSLTIPGSIREIEQNSFYDCTNLSELTICEGVAIIGPWSFRGCTGLKDVVIPASVRTVGTGAFANCSSLTAINAAEDNLAYCTVDGVLYTANMKTLCQYPAGKTEFHKVKDITLQPTLTMYMLVAIIEYNARINHQYL